MLRSLPHELGRLFQLQVLGLAGNPLCQDVLKLYSEPNGTHRLLMYLLDSLQGKISNVIFIIIFSLLVIFVNVPSIIELNIFIMSNRFIPLYLFGLNHLY